MRKKMLIGVAAAFVLAGCGGSSGESNAEFNASDTMFSQMMIPHHEQAIELADMALDPATGASENVRALASRIKAEQDPEITQMKEFLAEWDQPVQADPSMDHSSMMSGMLSPDQLTALGSRRGTDFDNEWLRAMIAHHEGAVDMAEEVVNDGRNTELRSLAESVISSQKAEIEEMQAVVSG
jgi:uncharacterized protein (DUF305 family)